MECLCTIRSSLQGMERGTLHGMSLHDKEQLAGHGAGTLLCNYFIEKHMPFLRLPSCKLIFVYGVRTCSVL